ncbi:hypothetical protein PHYBLDRAFT_63195 [Phycomyces blakesleeanus NRRL 1555(-)]|uniref:Uncharacterized protein n=1 Tax=Phycomyces blakesleeanus (strain ATCC 8743b / DSM 1359 / FGSC 10004 / NBRC 33097 / NRRL 1555) TaxID=763407 RepID=A0A167NTX2_PHYB8|nr:hypothetical protein PHYBLDRAFT_63195 [Phycomyces blakesleeanus NRRL 1555(-)]OAD76596.1 hypothetical protein PHYBLDRAFT_63195 [Phycomyces blakesleeanus NRRL 1555(-)]|eukprot:XP_018294636.1 hypothetical protein PHYBLDRAFT_63195 [Phycomyces blakesleeanus NRRL 1555(-)]
MLFETINFKISTHVCIFPTLFPFKVRPTMIHMLEPHQSLELELTTRHVGICAPNYDPHVGATPVIRTGAYNKTRWLPDITFLIVSIISFLLHMYRLLLQPRYWLTLVWPTYGFYCYIHYGKKWRFFAFVTMFSAYNN